MPTMFCNLCGRPVEARRHIGVGTVCLAVISAGVWLLAVPFYPKRCSICRTRALSPTAPGGAGYAGGASTSTRLADLERRLSLTEGELEAASTELDRLRTERDFYRQLLGDPTRAEGRRGTE